MSFMIKNFANIQFSHGGKGYERSTQIQHVENIVPENKAKNLKRNT